MIFFLFEEKIVNPDFKIYDVILDIAIHYGSYTYAYFFWNLSSIKMKFGHILVCCMKNIYNMILTQCWRLETSSRPVCDFMKMTI